MTAPTARTVLPKDRRVWVIAAILCLAFCLAVPTALGQAQNQVYYLSPIGSDSNSGTSVANAWATFERALDTAVYPGQTLSAGDMLIVLDGTYYQSIHPKGVTGQPGAPVTIRAQNDGKVTIDGQGQRIPVWLQNYRQAHYFVVEGIVARNSSQAVYNIETDYNELRRVSGYDANTDTNSHVFTITGDYNTLEDCVASGTGRKMILTFMGDHNTFRRCIADWLQWDGSDGCGQHWPWGEGIEIYGGNYNILENSISYGNTPWSGVSLMAQAAQTSNSNQILGMMSILSGMQKHGTPMVWGDTRPGPTSCTTVTNFDQWPSLLNGFRAGGSGTLHDNLFQDIFAWGNARYGLTTRIVGDTDFANNRVNRATIVNNGLNNIAKYGGIGADASQEEISAFSTIENSNIGKIWTGSSYTSMNGEGARLQHRYVDGVLMDGTNGQPAQPLWPWPMEDRIKAELGYSVTELMTTLINENTLPPSQSTPTETPTPINTPTATPTPGQTPVPDDSIEPRVYIPHLSAVPPPPQFEPAIFWFGDVGPTDNHADVRVWHYDDYMKAAVHIIDRHLWFDSTPTESELAQWDAVSLYVDLDGDTGNDIDDSTYRFINQLWGGPERQAMYQGSGSGWTTATGSFTATHEWRGDYPNNIGWDAGWQAYFEIPFSSLGLSGRPPPGTEWRFAVVLHDRDDADGSPIPDKAWPETMDPERPSTWGTMSFGIPSYAAPTASPSGVTTVRQGLNGAIVSDAHVGGHGNCGGTMNAWTEWPVANYAGYDRFNIQNQWDISDFMCFSKYYVTFPLDQLPPNKEIVSATVTLTLFGNAGYEPGDAKPSAINVLTVAEDWDEQSINWNNAPLATENLGVTWVDPVDFTGRVPYDWDVSRAVAAAYAQGQPLRLAFYSTDGDYHSGKYFWTSDFTGGDNSRPTLNVAWADAGSVPPSPSDGDVNCSSSANSVDALYMLQHEIALRGAADQCPLPPDKLLLPACDVNVDGNCNAADALVVLQCTVGIANVWCSSVASAPAVIIQDSDLSPSSGEMGSALKIDPVTTQPGAQLSLPIRAILTEGSVGATTIELQYDPAVLQPISCNPDPTETFDLSACNLVYESDGTGTDAVRFTMISIHGVTDEAILARPVFKVVGHDGHTTLVEAVSVTWSDPSGNTTSVENQTAEVRIAGPAADLSSLLLPLIER